MVLLAIMPCRATTDEITVADRIKQIGPVVRDRIKPMFMRQRVEYPPRRLAFAVIKDEMRLKVYASQSLAADADDWRFVAQYQIAKLSGDFGPKLRNGDKQVPEGIYRITYLHPASKYWLSLGLDYPNSFDRARAREDGRRNLGGDIMIHGWWFSAGCVAVGNTAAEDLFVMAEDVGQKNVSIIISPVDFRSPRADNFSLEKGPRWTSQLYRELDRELSRLGTDGLTTDSRLIAYNDLAPPPAARKSLLQELLDVFIEVIETSSTQTANSGDAK